MEKKEILKNCMKCAFHSEVGASVKVDTCIRGGILVGNKGQVVVECPIGKGKGLSKTEK